ncbi:MAG: hypothetical protein K4571_09835 [Deltaproteobacteria bacterium]
MVGDKCRIIPCQYTGKDSVILTLFIRTPVWLTSSARTNPIMPGTGGSAERGHRSHVR